MEDVIISISKSEDPDVSFGTPSNDAKYFESRLACADLEGRTDHENEFRSGLEMSKDRMLLRRIALASSSLIISRDFFIAFSSNVLVSIVALISCCCCCCCCRPTTTAVSYSDTLPHTL